MTPSAEIPFWIHDRPKWISGITRQTTCQDILHALVKAERKSNGNSFGVNGTSSDKHHSRDRNSSSSKGSNSNSLPRGSSNRDKIGTDERREDITCRKISRQLALVEQWRGVERPLSGSSRILKLWNAWGEEKNQVKFTIKRISSSSKPTLSTNGATVVKPIPSKNEVTTIPRSSAVSKRPAPPPPQPSLANLLTSIDRNGSTASTLSRSRKPRRRNSRASASSRAGYNSSTSNKKDGSGNPISETGDMEKKHSRYEEDIFKRSETVHPNALLKKRVSSACANNGAKNAANNGSVSNADIERLMKIILTQGETIHAQLKRLREREGQIENIEQQVHDSRTRTAGKDYLLNAYLNDSEQNHSISSNEDDTDDYQIKANKREGWSQRKLSSDRSVRDPFPRTSSPNGTSTHFKSLQDMLSGLNQVLNINDRIVSTEEHINDLQCQLTIADNHRKLDENIKFSKELSTETEEETSSTRSELVELKSLNDKFGREIEANRKLIRSMKSAFDERRALVAKLEEDVSSVESEGHQLRAELASIQESRQRQTLEILSKHAKNNNIDMDSEIEGDDDESDECDDEDIPILFADAAFLKNDNQPNDRLIPSVTSPTLSTLVNNHPPPTSMLLRNGNFQISNEQLYDQNHLPSHNPRTGNGPESKVSSAMNGNHGLQQQDPRSLYDELQRRLQIKTTELQENCEELQTLQPAYKSTVPGHMGGGMMGMMMLDPNITNRITATGSPGSASSSGNSSGSGGSYGSQGSDGKTVRFSEMDRILATPELPDHLDDMFPPAMIPSQQRSQANGHKTHRKHQDCTARANSNPSGSLSDITKPNSKKSSSRQTGGGGSIRGPQSTSLSNGGGAGTNSKSKSMDNVGDTDSNSDTGLSSLHSSSDEGTYVLDTLV